MSWAFDLAIRGRLREQLASDFRSGEFAAATAVRRRTRALKVNVQKQMTGAGLGRLANLVRARVDPARGGALNAHGTVDARPIAERPGGPADPLAIFDEGVTITIRGKQFLALWQAAAGRRGRSRADVAALLPQLKPKRAAGGHLVLVFRNQPTVIAFVLVPTVHLRKRLDLDALVAKAGDGLDVLVATDWERRDAKYQAANS